MSKPLAGRRILVVEDEHMIAVDVVHELEQVGATVVGPCGTVAQAMKAIIDYKLLDAAVLDINLREQTVYQVADRLQENGVPFLFTTGYDASAIPEKYRGVPRCEKPIDLGRIGSLMTSFLGAS